MCCLKMRTRPDNETTETDSTPVAAVNNPLSHKDFLDAVKLKRDAYLETQLRMETLADLIVLNNMIVDQEAKLMQMGPQ